MNDDFEIKICAKCGGKCCREGVYITKKEFENLADEFKQIFKYEKFMNGYRTKESKCPFLGRKGCVIPQKDRFIECKLFPFEIAGIDKLIINESALKNCIGLEKFVTNDYYEKCYKILRYYVSKKLLTKEDVESILNNEYEL